MLGIPRAITSRSTLENRSHLIQPRRIRRREVEMHVRMRRPKMAKHMTLVRRQIVQNDVDLPRRCPFDHHYEELHKLLAGVAGGGLAEHFASCVSTAAYSDKRAVTIVFKTPDARRGPAKAVVPDRAGRAPELLSFHPRRTPPRAARCGGFR
jgi:hypothetical protein